MASDAILHDPATGGDPTRDDVSGGDPTGADMTVGDPTGADMTVGDPTGDGSSDRAELRCPFGASPGAAPGSRPRPKRGYLIPGSIALVVCAAIATVIDLAGMQSHTPSSLVGRQVESYISQSIQYAHPQASPPQVRCPANEPLRRGLSFDCTLVRPGRPLALIRVTETSAHGAFRYQPPPTT